MAQWRIGLLLAIVAFVVFMANGRVADGETDSVASRTLPFSILGSGSLYLDPVRDVAIEMYPRHWWAVKIPNGRLVSLFPIWTPVLVTPLYGPAVAYLAVKGWTTERVHALSLVMERLVASGVCAGAVALLFFALLRRGLATRDALLLAAAFAFGTSVWPISSQELWLHCVAQFLCAGTLWLLTGPATRATVALAGCAIAIMAWNRPPDATLAAGLGVAAALWAGRRWLLLILAAAAPSGITLFYNLHIFGHWLGGWGVTGVAARRHYQMLGGIAGLLFSPARGLFVFSPFLLLFPLGIWRTFQERKDILATAALLAGVAGQVLIYSVTDWRAGWSYGPRYMLDAVPVLIWLLAPALAHLRSVARGVFVVLIAFSVWVQYVGAFHYNSDSNRLIFKDDSTVARIPAFENAWKLEHTPFIVEFRNSRQPANLPHFLDRL
jgi:hypothetical protein